MKGTNKMTLKIVSQSKSAIEFAKTEESIDQYSKRMYGENTEIKKLKDTPLYKAFTKDKDKK